MSSLTTLARPYAKAAFALAREQGDLAGWGKMLDMATEVVTDPALTALLDHPNVSPDQVTELIKDAAGDSFSEAFNGFLKVISDNRRLGLLWEVTALYRRLREEAEQRMQVRVVSAVPMDADRKEKMQAALAKRFECEIELENEVDASVLGGAVIYTPGEVIDGSLRGRLVRLESSLSG